MFDFFWWKQIPLLSQPMSLVPVIPVGDLHEVFSMFAPGTAEQIEFTLGCLGNVDWQVRAYGLHMLDERGSVVHTAVIVGMLTDPSPHVRRAALEALGKHERSTLASHAGAIMCMFVDSYAGVRYDALCMFGSDAMGILAPDVVAFACIVVTNMLTDEDTPVRLAATNTMGKLKRKRAWLHWATVRAFVLVRPWALFWHMYVGEQLCAPGGKWAVSDRTEFEYAFIEQIHEM